MLLKSNGDFNILNQRQRKAIEAILEIGTDPGSERSAADLAQHLGLSRESVHQLLVPFVRTGLLVAVRGRSGGYRAGAALLETPLSSILAPFSAPASRSEPAVGPGPARLVEAVEAEAAGARRAVYERTTVGQLVSRLAAERGALDWEI